MSLPRSTTKPTCRSTHTTCKPGFTNFTTRVDSGVLENHLHSINYF